MRILKIRFQNLNSLVGTWVIDLTHPAYVSDGIFAITGPTGSGKTTVLDAVCLALYGRTPRLSKVTKSGNEILSRQTGACFAEVTFETQAGRFRCHWSQHRARKKPDGELQPPRHEIADADTDRVLESNIRGVADRIETVTGMDFDRFTRSMLLAQGGFAAFLQAAPDERAPILEQITGTGIYSDISVRVHETLRSHRELLDRLLAETAGIVPLDPEQEQELRTALKQHTQEEQRQVALLAALQETAAWQEGLKALRRELDGIREEEAVLKRDADEFEPQRERLERDRRATSVQGVAATVAALRQQQKEDREELARTERTLPERDAAVRAAAEALREAETRLTGAKQAATDAAPVLRRVRVLDQKLEDQNRALSDVAARRAKAEEQIRREQEEKDRVVRERNAAARQLTELDAYLERHEADAWLVSGMTGMEEQLKTLAAQQRELDQIRTGLAAAEKRCSDSVAERDRTAARLRDGRRRQEEAADAQRRGQERMAEILEGRLLREYRAERDALLREQAYLTRIAELEDYRSRLEDGAPCPLCGATEHPFARGNIPAADETEQRIAALDQRISDAEQQETKIREQEQAVQTAREQTAKRQREQEAAEQAAAAAQEALNHIRQERVRIQEAADRQRRAVWDRVRPMRIGDLEELTPADLSDLLQARLNSWQAETRKKAEQEQRIAALDSDLRRLDGVISTQESARDDLARQEHRIRDGISSLRGERETLFGTADPDRREQELSLAVEEAGQKERSDRERHGELQRASFAAVSSVTALKERIAKRIPDLQQHETELATALTDAGFEGEEAFRSAVLDREQRETLTTRARELDRAASGLSARRADREQRLAAETARQLTDRTPEEIRAERDGAERELAQLREHLADARGRLRENDRARARLAEQQSAVDAQRAVCRRWERLHELIGSADGKKYRNFAQGLTFDMMIGHANRQLMKMTDRYLLVRDEDVPLDLNVVDNYQAGETRSTRNLSGGESFLVSSALALGLSHMASRNVRVDSLFLDEGFGSLDEDALDTALETLAGLQQDGKLIGVISHVPALKERIATQIQITPGSGGRSRISGPGCGRDREQEQG